MKRKQDDELKWVSASQDDESLSRLRPFYERRLIAAEKKPFLIDLAKSFGSHLAVEGSHAFIHDACSQIATLGLGFNASPLFAPCQHLESWTGDCTTKNIQLFADSYRQLVKRMLGPAAADHHVHFCASGAEAIETSLGVCFQNRLNRAAKKVLAFEGSFHGRMLVALSATWNPKKREPFVWSGYDSDFAPYPVAGSDSAAAEQQALDVVREKLQSGQFFAILLEPMQCEGGDRYSSAVFHQQLVGLAHSFDVPVVYDEVQTGFHLGDRFFWHSQFDLLDGDSMPMAPAVIACAKKSQVGIVISRFPIPFQENFCPASLIRGCASAWMIVQHEDQILRIGELVRDWLAALVSRFNPWIENPRSQGMAFAFDFLDPDKLHCFVQSRFDHGLLFYPAGERTARFRLNLSTGEDELALLWRQLDRCLAGVFGREPVQLATGASSATEPNIESSESSYRFQVGFAGAKRMRMLNRVPDTESAADYLRNELANTPDGKLFDIVVLNADNYPHWRKHILLMQTEVYEPVRQTPPEEFDALFAGPRGIDSPALLLIAAGEIAAMAFCGPLASFPQERGVSDDPYYHDPLTYYMLDLTVAPDYRGHGLGRVMKNALTLLAAERGIQAIHGRNRDRLARAMWTINLSLGSFELQHLPDDYPDEQRFRDCLYYRCPVTWEAPNDAPGLPFAQLDIRQIDNDYFRRNAAALVNKICLSNFVTRNFLWDLDTVAQVIPQPLRHLYTASSLSESIDKVAKAIWLNRQPRNGLLTVDGHYFGEGSFLARSLSGVGEPYFAVSRITKQNLLVELERHLDEDRWLAFFVQADQFGEAQIENSTSESIGGFDLLAQCVRLCRAAKVPIVVNETGPRFGSDRQSSRILESRFNLLPDAGVAWLGGQMSLTYMNDVLFVDDPLLLISTWDGDAYGLARFAETVKQMRNVNLKIGSNHD